MEFRQAIDNYYDRAYFGGVDVEIHSPGYFGRPMKKAAMAGYVSVMLALSGSGITAQDAVDAKVINSANAAASVCDMELEADIRETMGCMPTLRSVGGGRLPQTRVDQKICWP